jgi:hypothetical protein
MRRIFLSLLLAIPTAAWAQSGRINIDIPRSLAAKAAESVDINLDGAMLRMGARFLSDDESEERTVREMVRKLDGIYVRNYEFDEEGAYDRSFLANVRSQLGPDWKRIVTVQSRRSDNVEIYAQTRGDIIAGLVILSAEPRELTIVNIVGPIDLDKLASLEGQFGIPRMSKGSKHE